MTLKQKSIDKGLLSFLSFLFQILILEVNLSNQATQLFETLTRILRNLKIATKNLLSVILLAMGVLG